MDAAVNDLPQHWQFSVDRAGTLYFTSTWKGVNGVFLSRLAENRYTEPRGAGERINGGPAGAGFPFIAPDGNYLFFTQGDEISVSFREANGTWGEPFALGPEYRGILPIVSPDGRYLFFCRGSRAYWADAMVIGELKSKR